MQRIPCPESFRSQTTFASAKFKLQLPESEEDPASAGSSIIIAGHFQHMFNIAQTRPQLERFNGFLDIYNRKTDQTTGTRGPLWGTFKTVTYGVQASFGSMCAAIHRFLDRECVESISSSQRIPLSEIAAWKHGPPL